MGSTTKTIFKEQLDKIRLGFIAGLFVFSVFLPILSSQNKVNADDDYPWKDFSMSTMSPLKFYHRNCTDFVAWRINKQLGSTQSPWKFTWGSLKFPGGNGNAVGWKDGASTSGYTVDSNPAVGSVAWWDGSVAAGFGHVAIVSAVNQDGSVNVEEYNYGSSGKHGARNNVKAHAYLHIADIASGWGGVGSASFIGSDKLNINQALYQNQYILSENVNYVLLMQSDGNLVLYGPGGRAFWSSSTSGLGGVRTVMQSDGNLVMYRVDGVAVWSTGTFNQGLSHLAVQSDGNVVVYKSNGVATWQTGSGGKSTLTYSGSDKLGVGMAIFQSQYIRSADKRYAFLMQSDGNLVLYGPGYHVLWSANSSGSGATRAVMQSDGNFVLYNSNNIAKWHTQTGGRI